MDFVFCPYGYKKTPEIHYMERRTHLKSIVVGWDGDKQRWPSAETDHLGAEIGG